MWYASTCASHLVSSGDFHETPVKPVVSIVIEGYNQEFNGLAPLPDTVNALLHQDLRGEISEGEIVAHTVTLSLDAIGCRPW